MDNLPFELHLKVLQNLTNLKDFQNVRLVSKLWKDNVMEACRNFHVVFPLTDSTLHTASQLNDFPISFDIYAFTGKEKEVWASSSIEVLLETTEWLQFRGNEVNAEEISKIIALAHISLKTLSFKCFQIELPHPFLEMQESFRALRKLCVGYHSVERYNDTFATFTNTLEKWTTLDCKVQLPVLQNLILSFDGRPGIVTGTNITVAVTTEDLYRHYIVIGKLLLKYKQTLKVVQIERRLTSVYALLPRFIEPEWLELERGLEALDELNLNQLKISTKSAFNDDMKESLVIEVLGRPKNLKNLLFNTLICPHDNWGPLVATLSSFNNVDSNYLTSIKITLVLKGSTTPTLAINFEGLNKCGNLKTLWLIVNTTGNYPAARSLFGENVQLLPKGISILRFESAEENYTMGNKILMSQQQIRWIIDNLRGLESFWMSLVIPERINENEQKEDAGENNENVGNAQAQQDEDINRRANITLDSFRDLIAMPKLKDLKVDMMVARALNIVVAPRYVYQAGMGTTMDAVREYSDLCEAAGHPTTLTTTTRFGADWMAGFATLTMRRD